MSELPAPAVGQVWRGNQPGLGYGQFADAVITEVTDRHILLRWPDGTGHHTTPEQFGPQHLWSFVREAVAGGDMRGAG